METKPYKQIPLTKGKFALVDAEDFDYLNQWKWLYGSRYAKRAVHTGVINGKQKRKEIIMHRLIMNAPKDMEVDHINRDKLDNRKCNLRLATRAENGRNREKCKNNTSGYVGVSFDATTTNKDRKWLARIKMNYKLINLGRFMTKEEAAKAYNEAATKYFGEFAVLNQI